MSAAAAAGFRVETLIEHTEPSFAIRQDIVAREADGRFRLRLGGQLLPVMFTLIARA